MLRTSNSAPVLYAFCIPTTDLREDLQDHECSDVAVQILPASFEQEISKYCEKDYTSDENCEFIAWDPIWETYAYVDRTENTNWYFQAGVYAYLLNNDGTYKLEWAYDNK